MKKHLHRRCEYCQHIFPVYRDGDVEGQQSADGTVNPVYVYWQSDPFQAEMNEDFTRMWLCSDCAYESMLEI